VTARPVLVLDTATSAVVVGVADVRGALVAQRTWTAGHRHSETVIPMTDAILAEHGIRPSDLAGVIVGTGPGAFTGLRVGIATAKGLAAGLGIPIVGVPTSAALLAAAAPDATAVGADGTGADRPGLKLLLPAGPWDRLLIVPGTPAQVLRGGDRPAAADEDLVAVDLAGRAPAVATARGQRALAGLARALATIGTRRLADAPAGDDLGRLAPEYATLPRGVSDAPAAADVVLSRG
jgi:tRNA threonylcarbamoyl adenosine modification protein YeaZ